MVKNWNKISKDRNRLKREIKCLECWILFHPLKSSKVKNFCSRECASKNRNDKKMEEIFQSLINWTCKIGHGLRTIKKSMIKHFWHTCFSCWLSNWLSWPIPLEVHHINWKSLDHRLENLQLLCPNCHALTDNYKFKNKKSDRER